jgi:hypothetical protein
MNFPLSASPSPLHPSVSLQQHQNPKMDFRNTLSDRVFSDDQATQLQAKR